MRLRDAKLIVYASIDEGMRSYGFRRDGFIYTCNFGDRYIRLIPSCIELVGFQVDFSIGCGFWNIKTLLNSIFDSNDIMFEYSFNQIELFKLGKLPSYYFGFKDDTDIQDAINKLLKYTVEFHDTFTFNVRSPAEFYSFINRDFEYFVSHLHTKTICAFIILAYAYDQSNYIGIKRNILEHNYYLSNRYVQSTFAYIEKLQSFEVEVLLGNTSSLPTSLNKHSAGGALKANDLESSLIDYNDEMKDFRDSFKVISEETGGIMLIFNHMPPLDANGEQKQDDIFVNFDKVLEEALKVNVIWDDRERFYIPYPKNDTIEKINDFLNSIYAK